MTYTIEPNLPIPDKHRTPKYPFGRMDLFDSFEFDVKDITRVSSAASEFGIRHNKKFLVRNLANGKARCWRVDLFGSWAVNGEQT